MSVADPDLMLHRIWAWDELASAAIRICIASEPIDLTRARLFLCIATHCRGVADEYRRAFNSTDLMLTHWSSCAKPIV